MPLTARASQSGQADADGERFYALSAQPLAQALAAFARESGVDIFFETKLTNGRMSAPLNGRHTPAIALRLLLAGTGLEARFTDRKSAFVFSPASVEAASVPTTGRPRAPEEPALRLDMAEVRARRLIGGPNPVSFEAYAHRAVRQIRAMLNAGGGFTGNTFDVAVIVRVDPMGRIDAIDLTAESRSRHADREAEIRERLVGRSLSEAPPQGFDLPLRFAVTSVKTSARRNAP